MKYTLHLDSLNALKSNSNPFDCTFMLGSWYKNVHSITLKSCEIPVAFYNIRRPYNTFTDVLTRPQTTYTIPEGSYTLSSLIGALNSTATQAAFEQKSTSLKVAYRTTAFRLGVSNNIGYSNVLVLDKYSVVGGITQPMYINYPNSRFTTLTPDLSWFLGFDGTEPIISSGTDANKIIANNVYNFSFDNYVRLCLPFTGMSSREIAQTTFKVPINVGYGGVMIYTNSQENKQTVYINGIYNKFDRIQVQIRDRFGNLISNNGVDWSLSLEIDCE